MMNNIMPLHINDFTYNTKTMLFFNTKSLQYMIYCYFNVNN